MSNNITFQPRMKNPCKYGFSPSIYSMKWYDNRWVNCYHSYPAYTAYGGYKNSGIGRENPQKDAKPLSANEKCACVIC